jgi:ribonuclease P/MRP protein subunit POP5
MKLLPSLRQKKRYIVFEIVSDKKTPLAEIEKEVHQALFNFIGQLGVAKAAPMFIKGKNLSQQRFILKINHKYVDEAKAALTLIKNIKNTPVIIKSLTTTGMIKKANKTITE